MGEKKKRNYILAAMGYGIVYIAILVEGILLLTPSNEMGYTILTMYLLLPVVSILTSIVIGLNGPKEKWITPMIMGILGYLLPAVVFQSWLFDYTCLFFSGIPSLVGMVIAIVIRGK